MKFSLRFFFAVLITFVLIGCQSELEKKESFLKKGSEYHENKEYKKADIELKNALQIDPEFVDAYHLLAKNMLKLGDIKGAFAVYNKIIQIDEADIEANLKLAEFLLLGKKPEEAMEKIVFVLEKEPDNIEALLVKSQIYMLKKFFNKASTVYEKILTIDPDSIPALQNKAKIHAINKNFEKTEELLLKTVEIEPASLPVRMVLIGFYIKMKNLEKVESQLKLAIENTPENPDAYILLGNFYFNRRKYDLAEEVYLNATDKASSALKPHLVLAGFYEKTNKKDNALKTYETALSIEPDNVAVKNTIARFHYKHKNIKTSEDIISEILSERPNYYPTRMLKSEILVHDKKFDEALRILDGLEKEEPKAPRPYYFKGLCFIGTGNYDQAKASVGKAVELNPGYFKARMLLSDIYLHERSYEQAQKEATTALKLSPNNYRTRIIRASSSIGLKKFDEAETDYQKLIETAPENPTAYYQLGLLKSAQKKHDTAIEYFNTAYQKNNKLLDVFTQLVKIHVIKKEFDTAHKLCQEQIDIYADQKPLIAVIHNIEAGIYIAQRDIKNAKKSLNLSISTHPEYLAPYGTLAKFALLEKNKDKAIEQYSTIVNKNPNLPFPHMMLGTIYDSSKEYEKAADHYKKALDINPGFAPAANNLAYHLLQRTDQIDEALRLARIAKEKFPEDPGVMDTLGMVYYKKELYGNALNEFLDSLKKIPNNPVVNYHLGLAYHKKKDRTLAINALKKALKLSDKFEDAEHARQLLAELED